MPNTQQPAFFGSFDTIVTAAPAAESAPQQKVLSLPQENQRMSNWCWAASAADVINFYVLPDTAIVHQCDLVKDIFSNVDCENIPPSQTDINYNKPQDIVGSLSQYHHFNAPLLSAALPFDQIIDEIDGNRPICCRMNTYEGHIVVLYGYQYGPGVQDVFIADPDSQKKFQGQKHYADLAGGADPTWAQTYLTWPKDL